MGEPTRDRRRGPRARRTWARTWAPGKHAGKLDRLAGAAKVEPFASLLDHTDARLTMSDDERPEGVVATNELMARDGVWRSAEEALATLDGRLAMVAAEKPRLGLVRNDDEAVVAELIESIEFAKRARACRTGSESVRGPTARSRSRPCAPTPPVALDPGPRHTGVGPAQGAAIEPVCEERGSMDVAARFALPGALLFITYGSGFWLTALGRPYQGLPFNLHKLIALAAVVFAVLRFYDLLKGGPVPFVVVVLTMLGIASVVALFSTGALLSVGSLPHAPLLVVHRVALVALPLAAVPMGFILLAIRS